MVDPRIAVRRALAAYLEAQLGGTYTGMKFFAEWPHGQALGALALQLFLGALTAGLRAGYVSGSGWFNWQAWPLMQGHLVPEGIDWSQGFAHAALSDPFLVHFIHRWWAWVVVGVLVVLARRVRAAHRPASIAIHSAFGTQILLGIATVMSGIAIWLAVLHQLVGALLLASVTWGAHALGRSAK